MAEEQTTNTLELLEEAGYIIRRVSKDMGHILRQNLPQTAVGELSEQVGLFLDGGKQICVSYHYPDYDQITAALDFRDFLEQHKAKYYESPNRTSLMYDLARCVPDSSPTAILQELRLRADLLERVMQQKK